MAKNKNIILVGFMGSGKTTIAHNVSNQLPEYTLIDIDNEIEKIERKKIPLIFEQNGEDYFRKLESSCLQNTLNKSNLIISTGGGIILNEKNRNLIKQNGIVFWLFATPENIYERIKEDTNRPLINTMNSKQEVINKIKNIMEYRFELYQEVADVIINTDKFIPNESASEIIKEFNLLF